MPATVSKIFSSATKRKAEDPTKAFPARLARVKRRPPPPCDVNASPRLKRVLARKGITSGSSSKLAVEDLEEESVAKSCLPLGARFLRADGDPAMRFSWDSRVGVGFASSSWGSFFYFMNDNCVHVSA